MSKVREIRLIRPTADRTTYFSHFWIMEGATFPGFTVFFEEGVNTQVMESGVITPRDMMRVHADRVFDMRVAEKQASGYVEDSVTKVESLTFVKEQVSVEHRISLPLNCELSVEEMREEINTVCLKLKAWLLKVEQPEMRTGHFKVPATWWQHFKQDHFPARWLQRYPVQYSEQPFRYERSVRLCPHSNTHFPEDVAHVQFLFHREAPKYKELPELENFVGKWGE